MHEQEKDIAQICHIMRSEGAASEALRFASRDISCGLLPDIAAHFFCLHPPAFTLKHRSESMTRILRVSLRSGWMLLVLLAILSGGAFAQGNQRVSADKKFIIGEMIVTVPH